MADITEYPTARQILRRIRDAIGNDYHVSAQWHDDSRLCLDIEIQGPSEVPPDKLPLTRRYQYTTEKNLFGIHCTNFRIEV